MDTPTIDDILDEVKSMQTGEELEPGEFTVTMYEQHHRLNHDTAHSQLERRVHAGLLTKRKGRGGVNIYRIAKK